MNSIVPAESGTGTLADLRNMAEIVVRSNLFPQYKSVEQVAALMLLCRAKGLDPMTAVERYHIVQGRPVMRADAMLSEFLRMGGRIQWHQRDNSIADATFSHPSGGEVRLAWTIEQAKASGLTNKDPWRQYPRQMLHARCVSEGIRSVFPGATNGLYTPEEAVNMEPPIITPMDVAPQPAQAKAQPEPQPEPIPNQNLVDAMMRFGDLAIIAGKDVIHPTSGNLSKSRLILVAEQVCDFDGASFDPQDTDHWQTAINLLEQDIAESHGDNYLAEKKLQG